MGKVIGKYLLHNQFLAALLIIAFLWFFLLIRQILLTIFISYIIMASLLPAVLYLKEKGLHKTLAVTIPFVTVVLLLFLLIMPLAPFFFAQIQSLVIRFPEYIDQAASIVGLHIEAERINTALLSEVGAISSNAIAFTQQVFGGIFWVLTILVLSFYLLMDHENFKERISSLFPSEHRRRVSITLYLIEQKLGAWLRGQLVLCFFIGALTWVLLTILGIEFALPLALIAGILEIVPTIGPIISAVPAVIVALTISPTLAVFVAIVYCFIQMIENNILVPKIMQRAVGLNPVIIIIGILIGGELMGVTGALLSIPFISLLIILYKSLTHKDADA